MQLDADDALAGEHVEIEILDGRVVAESGDLFDLGRVAAMRIFPDLVR
ncbi:MAG TPA: hypothetical protein VKH36_13660 [Acidimicrobiia bacterium]|nr:hypothetical protein [Acidimicrobiia bacterium]